MTFAIWGQSEDGTTFWSDAKTSVAPKSVRKLAYYPYGNRFGRDNNDDGDCYLVGYHSTTHPENNPPFYCGGDSWVMPPLVKPAVVSVIAGVLRLVVYAPSPGRRAPERLLSRNLRLRR